MKKTITILIAAASLLLSSCTPVYRNFTPIEQILVLQTMGVDSSHRGYEISLASGADPANDKPTTLLSGFGASITSALEDAGSSSYEENLFFSHVNHVLIGEESALRGLDPILDYICRSPQIRIDIPLYIVRDTTAKQAVTQCGTDSKGISEVMSALRAKLEDSGRSSVFTAAQVIQALDRSGGCLICAVELIPASEQENDEGSGGEGKTIKDSGYYIIKNGVPVGSVSPEDAPAVGLLINDSGIFNLSLRDRDGDKVMVEVSEGHSDLSPVWGEDGDLEGIDISVSVSATISETTESGEKYDNDADYADYLTGRLEQSVSGKLARVLSSSKKYGCDFLGLGSRIELSDGERFRDMEEDFNSILKELQIRITVSGTLIHSNDGRDS